MLASLSKILEKVVVKPIDERLWHPMQHSYRKNRMPTTVLLTLHEEWMEGIYKMEVNLRMGINMSAAVDVVDKDVLIIKIDIYGMDETVTQWIRSYMSMHITAGGDRRIQK